MNKPFWKSKACWGAVLVLLGAIMKALGDWLSGLPVDWAALSVLVGNALGVLGIRTALK